MSEENSPPPTPASSSSRRASFSQGQKFSDLFGRSPTGMNPGTSTYPGPITTAAANAQAQRRRSSITALGLAGSPTQSVLAHRRDRTESWSSGGTNSIDENAIEEGDAAPSTSPSSPFGRRLSFGARAYQEARLKSGGDNGNSTSSSTAHARVPSSSQRSPSDYAKRLSNQSNQRSGEGLKWSEQLRSRAERSSSITSPTTAAPGFLSRESPKSVPNAAAQPAAQQQPVQYERPKPDAFQERILKGDFYMD
ncbi:MAG: hypothetical protein HETSPECPRED_005665 [Heterodermia speciosa]|uniref:Uncharacterized protein n=1 Tax=Heterodermia speciosa TaxID=116794 RepID=A0A8H3FJR1_9LECA|nr:MAG: hypothetical protein HETSPECPRED_005665 [Heterodermia speciosa]